MATTAKSEMTEEVKRAFGQVASTENKGTQNVPIMTFNQNRVYLGHRSDAVDRIKAESMTRDENLTHKQKGSMIDFVMRHPARFTNPDDRFIGRLIARFWNREGKQ